MIANEIITINTNPTLIVRGGGTAQDRRSVTLVPDSAQNVFVGGSNVTTSAGVPLFPAGSSQVAHTFELSVNEDLYGIVQTSGTVRVLATRSAAPTDVGN